MSRDIEFRAKNVNGEWVYGFVAMVSICENIHWWKIFNFDNGAVGTSIDPKTLGQYTGVKDNRGFKVYEGDKFLDHFEYEYGEVFYCDEKSCFMAKVHEHTHDEYGTTLENNLPLFEMDMDDLEVVGNIHDNY